MPAILRQVYRSWSASFAGMARSYEAKLWAVTP